MKFNRLTLLHFYDDRASVHFTNPGRGSHVSAITGLIGEDLILGILCHYFFNTGYTNVMHLPNACKQSGRSGKHLDAWLQRDEHTIFQVEVKNWSAHSSGGRTIAADATPAVINTEADHRWAKYFCKNGQLPKSAEKILLDIPLPESKQHLRRERLLAFWFPISDEKHTPMSSTITNRGLLNIFSASLYLRSLTSDFLELDMPRVEERWRILLSFSERNL